MFVVSYLLVTYMFYSSPTNTLALSVTDHAKVLKCPKTSTCSNGINTLNHTKPMAVHCSCAPDDGCK
jgi:hypothetical protein